MQIKTETLFNLLLLSGKPADDEVKLGDLKLKPNTKIMMMGTREESLVGKIIKCNCIYFLNILPDLCMYV